MLKKIVLILGVMLLIVSFNLKSTNVQAVESENNIEIQLTLGEDHILINGETITIVKPFVEDDTTLVPLRVITEAFGAELVWISETQTVILNYGDKELELSIGSKTAAVNGVAQELPTEPQLVVAAGVGTTMVPIRFISENFGAVVSYNDLTRAISITGMLWEPLTDSSAINDDAGKTHFGDSFHGWSMKYPTGLVIDHQNFQGDIGYFNDANGEYELSIIIEKNENLTQSDLLKEISDYSIGTVLDQRIINEDDKSYANVISKDDSGSYSEIRGYMNDSKVYYIFFDVENEADYKDEAKYANYQDLLNSFSMSFTSSEEMKDISKVVDGYILYSQEDYGLSLKLPVDWTSDSWAEELAFANQEKEYYLNILMSSISEGDTLSEWTDREKERLESAFLDEFIEVSALKESQITGVQAMERTISTTYGSEWRQLYDVYFFLGDYKFNVVFDYKKDDYSQIIDLIQDILQSLEIDMEQLNESFGYIEEDTIYDRDSMREIISEDFNFSIEIPEYWNALVDNDNNASVEYGTFGNDFQLYSVDNLSYIDAINIIDYNLDQSEKVSADFKVISSITTTLDGIKAKKYIYRGKDGNGDFFQTTSYVLQKNGITYLIDMILYDATKTTENIKHMDEILSSLEIN